MSLAAPLQPLPSNDGRAFAIEVLAGNKRRITRRWVAPHHLTDAEVVCPALIEPWGTADAGYAGDHARTPEARLVYGAAYLVECRILPKPDRANAEGAPELRLLEKVYEETPYTRDASESFDAQGAIAETGFTAVLAVGQSLADLHPVAAGYSRIAVQTGTDAGRVLYAIRDVRGEGELSTGLSEDGEGIIQETGREVHMSLPAKPAPGAYDTWTRTARAGFWEVSWSRPAAAQLAAPGRDRRTRDARSDGSITETVTESGTAPTAATALTGGTIIQVGETTVKRPGGILTVTKHWLKLPADRSQSMLVEWLQPGVASIGGTLGSAGDAYLKITAPVRRRLVGTLAVTYGTGLTVDLPWQITDGFYFQIGGTLARADGEQVPVGREESHPNVVGDCSITSTSIGKWNGLDIVILAGSGSSTPATLPAGEFVVESSVSPYAASLAGGLYFEKRTERATR
jgi:hypothetical protein